MRMTVEVADREALLAAALKEREGSHKEGDLRILKNASLSVEDPIGDLHAHHTQYYTLKCKEEAEGKFRPTVVKDFDEARKHYNRFLRQRYPVNLDRLKKSTSGAAAVAMMPFMYEINTEWGTDDAATFTDQWDEGRVNAKLGKKDNVLMLPTLLAGGTDKPYKKGDVIMLTVAMIYRRLSNAPALD